MFRSRLLLASLFVSLFLISPVLAEEAARPDDTVGYSVAAEDWVTTKTVHVTLNVEAAVTAATAGSMRADMQKAVEDVAKSDWRLVGFTRGQDQTGLDRWSAVFESRLPESSLGSLADATKKASKPGMQLAVGNVDFDPTLDETQAIEAGLRTRLYKQASDQLVALNTAFPGRSYRVSQITFDSGVNTPAPRMARPMLMRVNGSSASAQSSDSAEMAHSEKMTMTANIVYAALPSAPAAAH